MEETLISESINWFQAFVMALYSVTIMFFGVGILSERYSEIVSLYNLLAGDFSLYIVWLSYGILILGVLSLVLMGFSLGFHHYDYALIYLGLAFLLTGVFDIAYLGILYLVGTAPMNNVFYIVLLASVLKLVAGALSIKLSRDLGESPNFIPLVAIALAIPFISGLTVFMDPGYTAADVFEMIWDYAYNTVSFGIQDIVYLSLGGYLSTIAILSVLFSLILANRAGDPRSSFGAKLSLTFGAFSGILGILLSSLGNALEKAKEIIMYNVNAESSVLNHYFEALNIVTFFGLLLLAFFILSSYYVVVPTPREGRRERSVEETIERVTVTAEEKKEEGGEEIIEGLEELEFEEFEDLEEF